MLEWFFSLFDKLAQTMVWKTFASHFQWVDWFSFLFLVAGLIYGMRNGFIAEIGEILEMIVVLFVVLQYYPHLVVFVRNNLKFLPHSSVEAVCFIVCAAPVWFAVSWIAKRLKKLGHTQLVAPLRILGGGILGMFHLFLIFSFISYGILLLPFHQIKKPFEKGTSYTGYYLAQLTPKIHYMIKRPLTLFVPEKKESY